jgi:hypothetical protein
MGLVSHIVTYKVGKSRGRRKAERNQPKAEDSRDPDCLNYASFCKHFGSCDGQKCEYEEV